MAETKSKIVFFLSVHKKQLKAFRNDGPMFTQPQVPD